MSQVTESQVQRWATELLAQHELSGWTFHLDRARNRLGQCDYTRRRITLSRHVLENNDESIVRDTLLHEIAHARVGPGHAHDAVWRAEAARIGAQPHATADATVNLPPGKWLLVCLTCQTVVARRHHRRLQLDRVACRGCGPRHSQLHWQLAD